MQTESGAPAQGLLPVNRAIVASPSALMPWRSASGVNGVSISAARGVARWHAQLAPRMLPWPVPLAPDNHWVALAAA